jgi:hypothetical protein
MIFLCVFSLCFFGTHRKHFSVGFTINRQNYTETQKNQQEAGSHKNFSNSISKTHIKILCTHRKFAVILWADEGYWAFSTAGLWRPWAFSANQMHRTAGPQFWRIKISRNRLPQTLASLLFSSPQSFTFTPAAAHCAARRSARRWPEQLMVEDGDTTAAHLAGARAQQKLHAPLPWRPLLAARTHTRSLMAAAALAGALVASSWTSPSAPS